jgi:hypothetical protein
VLTDRFTVSPQEKQLVEFQLTTVLSVLIEFINVLPERDPPARRVVLQAETRIQLCNESEYCNTYYILLMFQPDVTDIVFDKIRSVTFPRAYS